MHEHPQPMDPPPPRRMRTVAKPAIAKVRPRDSVTASASGYGAPDHTWRLVASFNRIAGGISASKIRIS